MAISLNQVKLYAKKLRNLLNVIANTMLGNEQYSDINRNRYADFLTDS